MCLCAWVYAHMDVQLHASFHTRRVQKNTWDVLFSHLYLFPGDSLSLNPWLILSWLFWKPPSPRDPPSLISLKERVTRMQGTCAMLHGIWDLSPILRIIQHGLLATQPSPQPLLSVFGVFKLHTMPWHTWQWRSIMLDPGKASSGVEPRAVR